MLFSNGVLAPSLAAGLFSAPSFFFDESITDRLKPAFEHNEVIFATIPDRTVLKAGRWSWDGIEIAATAFKIGKKAASDDVRWYAGYFPNPSEKFDPLLFSSGHIFHPEEVQRIFSEKLKIGSWELPIPQPVFHFEKGELQSWWKIHVSKGRVFWLRESDKHWGEEVVVPLQANGKALLYRENKIVSSSTGLEQIELKDLIDVSYLRNRLFRVLNCLGEQISFSKCGNFARSLVGYYDFPFDSAEYSEMVGYYSIQRAMDWHRGIQGNAQKAFFENFGLKGPIDVFVRADAKNAPFYVPTSTVVDSPNPVIVVSTGEEANVVPGTLSFLSKDSDVFFHEFAHHIIYRSVQPKTAQSQSRALHEGLADFFTYAITGNNSLGESILGGEPLRRGDLIEPLDPSVFYPIDPYTVANHVSSLLWQLRQQLQVWQGGYNQIDKIIWDSIDLLPLDATLYQFACAAYVSALNFESENGLEKGSIASILAREFFTRDYFGSELVADGASCPEISDLLTDLDISSGYESTLPAVTTPKQPVTFTDTGKNALAPFGGSLYHPVQPRKTYCGNIAAGVFSNKTVPLAAFVPFMFIGWMLGRSLRWQNRFRKTRRDVEAK